MDTINRLIDIDTCQMLSFKKGNDERQMLCVCVCVCMYVCGTITSATESIENNVHINNIFSSQ